MAAQGVGELRVSGAGGVGDQEGASQEPAGADGDEPTNQRGEGEPGAEQVSVAVGGDPPMTNSTALTFTQRCANSRATTSPLTTPR